MQDFGHLGGDYWSMALPDWDTEKPMKGSESYNFNNKFVSDKRTSVYFMQSSHSYYDKKGLTSEVNGNSPRLFSIDADGKFTIAIVADRIGWKNYEARFSASTLISTHTSLPASLVTELNAIEKAREQRVTAKKELAKTNVTPT